MANCHRILCDGHLILEALHDEPATAAILYLGAMSSRITSGLAPRRRVTSAAETETRIVAIPNERPGGPAHAGPPGIVKKSVRHFNYSVTASISATKRSASLVMNAEKTSNTASLKPPTFRVTYYNTRRAHMERNHLPPIREAPAEVLKLDRDQIVVRSYVGGLVKSFERKAA